jgi:hypothetical protein
MIIAPWAKCIMYPCLWILTNIRHCNLLIETIFAVAIIWICYFYVIIVLPNGILKLHLK